MKSNFNRDENDHCNIDNADEKTRQNLEIKLAEWFPYLHLASSSVDKRGTNS
jgi:hypothetical protein